MGIAAYNRGSRAISNQLYPNDVRHTPAKQKKEDNLPEGILRSSWLPDGSLSGSQVFLSYENGWYLIHTRWQTLKRRRALAPAIKLFEKMEFYGLAALEEK